ncbi:hypothetical protein MY10362_002166 [Beauveria mimosiformis]
MRFVAEHTAILVPKVYSAFEHKAKVYIVMERIDGVDLAYGWYQRNARVAKPHPREPSRHDLAVAPDTSSRRACGVSNVDGGPIYDRRLPGNGLWGPFLTIHDFHRELRGGVDEPEFEGTAILELEPLIAFQKTSHGRILSSRTMPPYWEYTSAWNANPQNQFWRQEVDRFLEPLPKALEMEEIRRKYNGD